MISFLVSMLPESYLPLVILGGAVAIILGLVSVRAFIGFFGLLLLFIILAPFIESLINTLPTWILLLICIWLVFFVLRTILTFLLGEHGSGTFMGHLFYDLVRLPVILVRGIFRFLIALLSYTTRNIRTGGRNAGNMQARNQQAGRRNNIWIIVLLLPTLLFSSLYAEAKSPAQTVGSAAAKRIVKRISPAHLKKFGPIRAFKRDTKLVRVTNRPSLDKSKGLDSHSFWTRSKQGRNPSAAFAKDKLELSHNVKAKEMAIAKKGTLYHERPLKNGKAHTREVILEDRVRGRNIAVTGYLAR
ncbi:MAG: hypothetical protein HZA14_13120 [Nitrospirae bacterium]|nr:hypothetical protein [Nitrospirota bacterium]